MTPHWTCLILSEAFPIKGHNIYLYGELTELALNYSEIGSFSGALCFIGEFRMSQLLNMFHMFPWKLALYVAKYNKNHLNNFTIYILLLRQMDKCKQCRPRSDCCSGLALFTTPFYVLDSELHCKTK